MEEAKPKQSKLAKVGKMLAESATAIATTLISGIIVLILYVLYIPFAIGRALFNRKAIRGFYSDVFYAIDGIGSRMRKREQESA